MESLLKAKESVEQPSLLDPGLQSKIHAITGVNLYISRFPYMSNVSFVSFLLFLSYVQLWPMRPMHETNNDHQSNHMFSKWSLQNLTFLCHCVEGVAKSCILYHYCSITWFHEISQASAALGSASNVHIVQSKRCHGDLHMPHNAPT